MARSLREVVEQADQLADWFEQHGPSPASEMPVAEYTLGCLVVAHRDSSNR